MPWQMPRSHQHHVESQVQLGEIRAVGQEGLGGSDDASALARRQC